ncbi:MAG: hypothetical protein NVSMB32_05690 [Actinomycetota bacterium]
MTKSSGLDEGAAPRGHGLGPVHEQGLLEIRTERGPDLGRLTLSGELDMSRRQDLQDAISRLEAQGPALLLIDLASLRFMDSTGLGILVSAHKRARKDGRRLVFVPGPVAIQRLFEITGMMDVFEFVHDA